MIDESIVWVESHFASSFGSFSNIGLFSSLFGDVSLALSASFADSLSPRPTVFFLCLPFLSPPTLPLLLISGKDVNDLLACDVALTLLELLLLWYYRWFPGWGWAAFVLWRLFNLECGFLELVVFATWFCRTRRSFTFTGLLQPSICWRFGLMAESALPRFFAWTWFGPMES